MSVRKWPGPRPTSSEVIVTSTDTGRESLRALIGEHVLERQHKILWDEVNIVEREVNNTKRKIVEASFMSVNEDGISQPSKDLAKKIVQVYESW